MTKNIENYQKLEKKFEQITHLCNIQGVIHWDMATQLKNGSADNRQKEYATLASLTHELLCANEIGDLIAGSKQEITNLDSWQKANLTEIEKSYQSSKIIPKELQHRSQIASSECEFVWRSARAENDYKKLEPYLDKVFDNNREIANIKAEVFKTTPTNALIDIYDPGRKSDEIDEVFTKLKKTLPELIKKIVEKQKSEKYIPLNEKIDEATQKNIGLKIIEQMGFDLDRGRLDKSTHPFCIGSNDDVRLTTRYNEDNFLTGLFGIIHETGHGLYQQNLPAQYRNQPVGTAMGMAFHESQSLIMEMQAGTSKEFIEYLANLLKKDFGFKSEEYTKENLYKIVTRVKPNLIRVDADEITYPMHIILRYEIEKLIINDNLKAKDLPALWNEKMQEYLGIVPDSDANGCMQDIHWPSGLIGYFPSYTNGAIIASMAMDLAKNTHPEISNELSCGKFASINGFLNENFRKLGSSLNAAELLHSATGEDKINPDCFIKYLEKKYL